MPIPPSGLELPTCQDCNALHWYPKARCPRCGGSWLWTRVPSDAQVFAWTTVHHDFGSTTHAELPATVVLAAIHRDPTVRIVALAADCLMTDKLVLDGEVRVSPRGSMHDEAVAVEAHASVCEHLLS